MMVLFSVLFLFNLFPFASALRIGHNVAQRPLEIPTGSWGLFSFGFGQSPSPSKGSTYAQFGRAAVAADHGLCSAIGKDVMAEGGNAVDATIASLLCIGVVNPESAGFGGGFFMTIYDSKTGKCTAIDARETAPLTANITMYLGSPSNALIGYRSIATPGELHGYWTAFKRFGSGRITWKRLFEPSISLATNGFPISAHTAMALNKFETLIFENRAMTQTFVNPGTGRVYREGDVIRRRKFAKLMEELANSADPIELFYRGRLAKIIVKEMQENGAHISAEDLASKKTIIYTDPIDARVTRDGLHACGPPPPSAAALVSALIGVMNQFYTRNGSKIDLNDPLIYHRFIEAQKFIYAQRTKLGDMNFVRHAQALSQNITKWEFMEKLASMIPNVAQPMDYYSLDLTSLNQDYGTAHVSAIDASGSAVSATSTINQYMGAKRESPELGIIWNDSMDGLSTPNVYNAFGLPPSPSNFIAPGKRPMSSMSPMIIYDKASRKVKMVIGASGGSRIISAIAQTTIGALLFGQNLKEAVDAPRFHNQFIPHVTEYETAAHRAIVRNLTNRRRQRLSAIKIQKSSVQALFVDQKGIIHGSSDFRRITVSQPAGF